jgi:membrane-associated protease RseP (regulator of RpoE activity)
MPVWKDSPAARAGLQQGDVLKEVDGKAVETFNAQQVSTMLHAKEGTEIKLGVERNGVLSTIAVKTHALLCADDQSHAVSRKPRGQQTRLTTGQILSYMPTTEPVELLTVPLALRSPQNKSAPVEKRQLPSRLQP